MCTPSVGGMVVAGEVKSGLLALKFNVNSFKNGIYSTVIPIIAIPDAYLTDYIVLFNFILYLIAYLIFKITSETH